MFFEVAETTNLQINKRKMTIICDGYIIKNTIFNATRLLTCYIYHKTLDSGKEGKKTDTTCMVP